MARLSTGKAFTIRGRESRGLSGFAGKPLHPPLTDIPVGAYIIAAVLDVASVIGRDASWSDEAMVAAGMTMLVGFIVSVATALTGVADWTTTERNSEVRRMATTHGLLMVMVTLITAANLATRFFGGEAASTPMLNLALSLVGAVLLICGAAIGGALVYDHGFNVENSKDSPVFHAGPVDGEIKQRDPQRIDRT